MFTDLKAALLTWPDRNGWARCALISLFCVLLIGIIASSGGLIRWQPEWHDWPLRMVGVMFVPSFTEEIVFRGLLVPRQGSTRRPVLWITAGVGLFIVWHIVEALTFLPGAHMFLMPEFLLCAGILGLACALMRYETGTIWPAILLHGMVVFFWQVMLSGPDIAQLRH